MAAGLRAETQENSPVYLIREVRKLSQTDLFTSFEMKGKSPKLGGGKLHLAVFNPRSLTSFNLSAFLLAGGGQNTPQPPCLRGGEEEHFGLHFVDSLPSLVLTGVVFLYGFLFWEQEMREWRMSPPGRDILAFHPQWVLWGFFSRCAFPGFGKAGAEGEPRLEAL